MSVNISVESIIENVIQEISYDGTEIHQPPPTLSESLSKNASRIDFSKSVDSVQPATSRITDNSSPPPPPPAPPNDGDGNGAPTGTIAADDIKAEDDAGGAGAKNLSAAAAFQNNMWPWDSVRNKLRDAYTEVCVLSDVLSVAREKRYMVLDPVPQEPQETKPMVQVYARKKALTNAANVLLLGAERMRSTHNEQRNNRSANDFHIELLRLRQNWRLKKVGNTIVGDLSYRTAGSKFGQSGMFEVCKAEEEAKDTGGPGDGNNGSSPPSPNPAAAAQSKGSQSALRVKVPAELQGVAYLKVITQKDQEDLCTAVVNLNGSGHNVTQQVGVWQKTLEYAQNVLFCKELFNQLAREAVQLQAPIPHVVVGNQIRATLLPGIQLIISLCHTTAADAASASASMPTPSATGATSASATTSGQPPTINDHDHVLEHSLHQLLREVHFKSTHHPFPHPASGPLGPSKRRMLAGPMAADRHELLEMTKSHTILEQIIAQAQHIFMRKRTQYVLDTLARDVKDPQIISHWNAMNSPTMSCVKIIVITNGYDTVCRTSLLIQVKERSLTCIGREGRVMQMSYEPQELRDLILCQINQHQISGLQQVAKCCGWQTLSNSNHLGIGAVEPLGNASSCVLASPNGDRLIAVQIRCDPPQIDVKVYVAQSPRKDFVPGPLVQGAHWEHLGGHFKEVRFEKLEGKNFLNKMEFLMASLSSTNQ